MYLKNPGHKDTLFLKCVRASYGTQLLPESEPEAMALLSPS